MCSPGWSLPSLSLEEGPDHGRPVRFLGRRAQQSRTAPIWLRETESTAVNGHGLHLHVGIVAPEQLLDVNSCGQLGLVRLRSAGDVVEVRKILSGRPRRQDLAVPVEEA